jgi:hypothetical protein
MSATQDTATDWQQEAVRLRRDEKMATVEIAERFGKSASQVRKVIAQASTERHVNGSGPMVDEDAAERVGKTWGPNATQGDIEQALDKPEDPLHAFKREAGDPVGDMPPADPPADPTTETRLQGTQQMHIDFGPHAEIPVGGTLKLKSDKLASGFYGLGDLITGTFTARVVDVLGAERFQRASEEYRIQPQGHVALITEITVKPVE